MLRPELNLTRWRAHANGRGAVSRWGGLLVLLLLVAGCDLTSGGQHAGPAYSGPPPLIPSVSASLALQATTPAWVKQLPTVERSLKPGMRVWATVPRDQSEMADVAVYRVEGIHDGQVSLLDKLGQRIDGVAPAAVHPAGKPGRLRRGDVVLVFAWTAPGLLARVSRLGDAIHVRHRWAEGMRETAVDHAQPPVRGIQPLAYVGYPARGERGRGLIVALDAERAWIRTDSGHIEIVPRASLTELPVPGPVEQFSVGQSVSAYRWAAGYQPGRIVGVVKPGLVFRVEINGDRLQQEYFFTHLLAR